VQVIHPLGQSERFEYDDAGRLTLADAGAGALRYEYDGRGWLERVLLPNGASEEYAYTNDGLVASVVDSRGTTSIEYDALTRSVVRVTEPDGAYVRYAYDAMGNRTLLAHAAGAGQPESVIRYAWDALHRLEEVVDPDGGVTAHTYDASGNLIALARPNGVVTELVYDQRDRLVSVAERAPGGVVLDGEQYTLDAMGNRLREERSDGRSVEYDYDASYRVVAERHYGPTGVLIHQTSYAYDAVGNLVERQGSAGAATFVYDANNQLLAGDGVAYDHDDAGRRIAETRVGTGGATEKTTYAWDARDRLVRFEPPGAAATTYQYDAFGRRVGKSGPSGIHRFLVDRGSLTGFGQLLSDTSPSGPAHGWIHGTRLLQSRSGAAVRHHHADALGSTRILTDGTGTITDLVEYSAFGSVLQHAGDSDVRHLFAGEELDRESGLYYLRARYYDPRAGRFLTRDPAPGRETDPLSLNEYLYALANPVNRVDPSGQTTLMEQAVARAIEAYNKYGQTLANIVRKKEKAERVIGDNMRYIGGALSIYAIQDAVTNPTRPMRWFGAGASVQGTFDLSKFFPGVSGSVSTVASLLLGRTAIDLLGAAKVDFDLGTRCRGSLHAAVFFANTPGRRVNLSKKVWDVVLCPAFFASPPLPKASDGIDGKPSMAGIMVHEFTHISLRTRDQAYLCDYKGGFGKRGVLTLLPGFAFANADNYRCWVRDAALGFGNAWLDVEFVRRGL
jgi:RHS repeat-associated protein